MPTAKPEPSPVDASEEQEQLPDPADAGGQIGLPVAVVARRLGVAPATLRTWDRRYDLGPSQHAAGAHRRYGPADIARLETMRRLTLEGVAPGEAAAVARAQPDGLPVAGLPAGLSAAVGLPALDPAAGQSAWPSGYADAVVRGLGRAAMGLDSRAIMTAIRVQLREHGVLTTWDQVLRPVLAAAGDYWAATGEGVEVEHLLSDCVTAALREVADRPLLPRARPVLLASAPEEQHCLPLHAVAAALAERGTASRVLGPAMPVTALDAAIRRTGAAALFLWSQLPGTADATTLTALPVRRPPTSVIVGGPGWAHAQLPPRVGLAADLAGAVELVQQAAGG